MEMKDKRVKIVCSLVAVLGLVSAATAFAAEATKIKPSQTGEASDQPCVYPKSAAFPLGLTAAGALSIAHIVIYLETGWACRGRAALRSLLISLANFLYAFIVLLNAAAINHSGHSLYSWVFGTYDDHTCCCWVTFGDFTSAAFFSLASICSGLAYYLYLNEAKKSEAQSTPAGDPLLPQ